MIILLEFDKKLMITSSFGFFLKKYEQESFEYKRLIDRMRNEYESKINELTEDISFLKKQMKQMDAELTSSRKLIVQNESADIIQDLSEKNQKLKNQLKAVNISKSRLIVFGKQLYLLIEYWF